MKVKVKSYAKINLTLNVGEKTGGFHPIDSLVTAIDIYDEIAVSRRKDDEIRLIMRGIGETQIKQSENTAYKAALAFKEKFKTGGVNIEINKKIPVQIELGLQTSNEKTAKIINRGSTNKELIDAVKRLREKNIEVVIHIMNGLPSENEADMLNTIDFINSLDIQGIKIHSLCILKNTKMGDDYLKKPWPLLTLDEYIKITVNQIRHLRSDIIIHRLSADADLSDLIAPLWTRKKLVVMNEIDKLMRKYNYYQGDQFKKGHSS